MHELGVAQEMLRIALDYAAKNNAAHITALNVEMSAAADESEDSLRFHIENLARGTAAEDARVEITRAPAQVKCLDCGNEFAMDAAASGGPRCSSRRIMPLVRDEFRLASIDVE
jgi:hydrogenase nickel incorporation protein HypA/HybF